MNPWRLCWGAAAVDATKCEGASKIITTPAVDWDGREELWFMATCTKKTQVWEKTT